MVPCVQMPDMALGQINKDDLTEIWQDHPELNRFRNRREIPLSTIEFCKDARTYLNARETVQPLLTR